MNQVEKVHKQLNHKQWKSLINECHSSGMTVKNWCKENNICEQSYYRNLKLPHEEMLETLPAKVSLPDEKPTVFKRLEVQAPIPNTQAAVIIHLDDGATVKVNESTNQQTIQAVPLTLNGSNIHSNWMT